MAPLSRRRRMAKQMAGPLFGGNLYGSLSSGPTDSNTTSGCDARHLINTFFQSTSEAACILSNARASPRLRCACIIPAGGSTTPGERGRTGSTLFMGGSLYFPFWWFETSPFLPKGELHRGDVLRGNIGSPVVMVNFEATPGLRQLQIGPHPPEKFDENPYGQKVPWEAL